MLSAIEVNTMIGEVTLRRSKIAPLRDLIWFRVSLSPMNRSSTRNCSSSPFSWMKSPHHFSNLR